MPFNHYVKIKRILQDFPSNWIIKRINKPTKAQNFKGEVIEFDHYYRIYTLDGQPIKYCKFQQIERLAKTLNMPVESLPIIEE